MPPLAAGGSAITTNDVTDGTMTVHQGAVAREPDDGASVAHADNADGERSRKRRRKRRDSPAKLLAVASEYRRMMNPRRRNPGAHEDANAEIRVPPHLRTGHRFSLLGRRSAWERGYVCFGVGVFIYILYIYICDCGPRS